MPILPRNTNILAIGLAAEAAAAGWVNVKAEGAKLDGTTDDTAAIQAAITKGVSLSRPVFIPGRGVFTSQLTIPAGYTRIVGNGRDLSSLTYVGTQTPAIKALGSFETGGCRFGIEGIAFIGPSGVVDGLDVETNWSRAFYLDDVHIKGWRGWGLQLKGGHTAVLRRVLFESCGNESGGGTGGAILMGGTTLAGSFAHSVLFEHVSAESCNPATGRAIRINNADAFNWLGGTVESCTGAVQVRWCRGACIQGVHFEENGTNFAHLTLEDTGGILVDHNRFYNATAGTSVAVIGTAPDGGEQSSCTISNNKFQTPSVPVVLGTGGVGPRRPVFINNHDALSGSAITFSTVAEGPVIELRRGILTFYDVSGNVIYRTNRDGSVQLPVLVGAPSPAPAAGTMAIADRATWDPLTKVTGGAYPVWYNGAAWVALDSQ